MDDQLIEYVRHTQERHVAEGKPALISDPVALRLLASFLWRKQPLGSLRSDDQETSATPMAQNPPRATQGL